MAKCPPITPAKTFCEFFSGIGLVREALAASGWRCVYANDIDAAKQAMHDGHFGDSPHYHCGDVWDTEAVLGRITEPPLLATASFPCTDMSLAGKRRGFTGEESSTFYGFTKVLEQLGESRPRLVLLENVAGFLTAHEGRDFAAACEELARRGYWVDSFVLDAKRFVPQSRVRLFVVGYHETLIAKDDCEPPLFCLRRQRDLFGDAWRDAVDRANLLRPQRLRDAIAALELSTGWATIDTGNPPQLEYSLLGFLDLDDDQAWWDGAQLARHEAMFSEKHREQINARLNRSEETFAMTGFRRMRKGTQRLEVRFDGVAGCLRTPRGGSAKQIVVVCDRGQLRMRWMTPREYARLQGAPDFKLPENTLQGLFGFGDAVCVPVIRWIDEQMLSPAAGGLISRPAAAEVH